MATTTLSSKYQVVIPKDVREKLHLKSDQKMTVITKGGVIYFIPENRLRPSGDFSKGWIQKISGRTRTDNVSC